MRVTHSDITEVESGIVAHGVNCQARMNSGVAKAIREKWPEVYNRYMDSFNPYSNEYIEQPKLGKVQLVYISDNFYVANCFTQEFYGNDGKRYADIKAIVSCLNALCRFNQNLNRPIHIPMIGCGLGGLDWEDEVRMLVAGTEAVWDEQFMVHTL